MLTYPFTRRITAEFDSRFLDGDAKINPGSFIIDEAIDNGDIRQAAQEKLSAQLDKTPTQCPWRKGLDGWHVTLMELPDGGFANMILLDDYYHHHGCFDCQLDCPVGAGPFLNCLSEVLANKKAIFQACLATPVMDNPRSPITIGTK